MCGLPLSQGGFVVVVQLLSCIQLFVIQWAAACQVPCSSLCPGILSNSCPLSWWYDLTILYCPAPIYFCLQSFPASGYFPMSWIFASGGQSIGASTSVSVLPMNIQGWFPLGLTGLISLHSKGLSKVSSSNTIQKHQFCRAHSSNNKESACNAGESGSISGSGRSLDKDNGYVLQYPCLENSMDSRARWATDHGVAKSQTQQSN